MGQEVFCTARWGGKSVRGKALLETSELIFRGDARLKIPFSTIRQATAENGELQLKTGDGLVVLELGERAEKWRKKISHPKTVVEKLGIKPARRLRLSALWTAVSSRNSKPRSPRWSREPWGRTQNASF